jgi:dihydrofolate reductase
MSDATRQTVAAFQMSLDGYMQGPAGEVDWVGDWSDALDLVPGAAAAVIGGGTYPGYAQLWNSIAADPASGAAMLGREPTAGELEYAGWTQRTPHYVVSSSSGPAGLPSAQQVRELGELRARLEKLEGDVYVVGGPGLISSLLQEGLVDELRIIVHPVILGGGNTPFGGLSQRHSLELAWSSRGACGRVVVSYCA